MSTIVLEQRRPGKDGDTVIVRWLMHSDVTGNEHVVSATAESYIRHTTGAHAAAMAVVAENVHRQLRRWEAAGRPEDDRPWAHLLTHRLLRDGVTFVPMNAGPDEEHEALCATARSLGLPEPKRSGMAPPLTTAQEATRTDVAQAGA